MGSIMQIVASNMRQLRLEGVASRVDEVSYKLRNRHRQAPGSATFEPRRIFVTVWKGLERFSVNCGLEPTNITPGRHLDRYVVCPDDGVNCMEQITHEKPAD